MGGTIKLSDIHDITFILEDGGLIVVDIKVIRCGKDGHHGRETSRFCLAVHAIPGLTLRLHINCRTLDIPRILSLMSTDNGKQIISLKELTCGLITTRRKSGKVSTIWWNTYVKKNEQPRTWLCTKFSEVFSDPKSSIGSDQRISHIMPCVGGSRNRSI